MTLVSTAVLVVGLGLGVFVVAAAFGAGRVNVLDSAARDQSAELAALVNADQLPEPLPVAQGQTAQVLAASGGVLAASAQGSRTLPLLPAGYLNSYADCRARSAQVAAIDTDGADRVAVCRATYQGQRVFVAVAASLADVRATESSLRSLEAVAAPVLVAVVACLSWLMLGRALGAVAALGAAASSVTDPGSSARLPVPDSGDEIRGLAVTLNAMLDRLAAAANRERAFLDDAAHELRTPLASAQLQLEVAALHPAGQDWPAVAEATTAELDRLRSLLDHLLALARLEAGAVRREPVDLSELAGAAGDRPVWVLGDRTTLRRAVDNLIANARQHARGQVAVEVTVAGGLAELHVDDDGPGIAPADRQRVFERFARLDEGRAREDGGAGLGLAIVAAAARAHGGDAFAAPSPLGGARVGFRIPVAPSSALPDHSDHQERR